MKTLLQTFDIVVACLNQDNDPDFFFCRVRCTEDDARRLRHLDTASRLVDEEIVEYAPPFVAYDQNSPAWRILKDHFTWESATIYDLEGREIS